MKFRELRRIKQAATPEGMKVTMKRRQKKLRITEADFMLANRRAARLEEIAEHGKPVSFRRAIHKSKKVYDRKRLKKMALPE